MPRLTVVFEGPVFAVESGTLSEPGGVRARRDIVRHSSSVAVLPVHADLRITLIAQYRCAFGRHVMELPAGRIDKGETPLQAARRELREETGLGARTWEKLLRILPTPGYSDEAVTLFRATNLFLSPGQPDPDERIEVLTLPLMRAVRLMRSRHLEDAKTVVALLLERQRRGETAAKSPVP